MVQFCFIQNEQVHLWMNDFYFTKYTDAQKLPTNKIERNVNTQSHLHFITDDIISP